MSENTQEDRTCSRCGKSVEDLPYEFWLFHACRSCVAEPAPQRWGDVGTAARKWVYFPRWHFLRHPQIPKWKREKYKGAST